MAEKPKVTTAGVVNVSQQYAANQRESRTPAPSYKIPSVIAAPKPATTQTLNLYGTPATNTRPSGGSTQTKSSKSTATTSTATTSPYNTTGPFNPMGGVGRGEYGPTSTSTSTSTQTAGKTVLRTVQNADGTTTIFYSDGTSETFGTPTTPVKKEIIPNVAYDTIQKILE